MKYLIGFVFLLSTNPAFSFLASENDQIRFVCQRYVGNKPVDELIILEQILFSDANHTLDSNEIERESGEIERFRLRIYKGVSFVSSEGSEEEVVEELTFQPAFLSINGMRMDGLGSSNVFQPIFEPSNPSNVLTSFLREVYEAFKVGMPQEDHSASWEFQCNRQFFPGTVRIGDEIG